MYMTSLSDLKSALDYTKDKMNKAVENSQPEEYSKLESKVIELEKKIEESTNLLMEG